MNFAEALKQVRSTEKKNFDQSVDLIINLKGIDLKRDSVSTIVTLPHIIKEKKICGFFNQKVSLVNTITPAEFIRYKDKKAMRKLVKGYDFFIAFAGLMPQVAANFGKVLGPAGKMPTPQLGIATSENDSAIKPVLDKISRAVKIRAKEASIKLSVGKESMSDEQLVENITAAYNGIVDVLPTKKDNVRSVMIKLTMGKPVRVGM